MHALFNLFRNLMNYGDSLRHKSYLTLPSVTSLRDPFCLSNALELAPKCFTGTQCILCSSLRHKSYLTLPYVTSLRDPFCLGTFACVFARKQCILCSALCHKSYLTRPYVTSLRDSFCLGTLAQGFIMLSPREATRWQFIHSFFICHIYKILQCKVGIMRLKKK